jgi:hypothetical protein
VAVATLFSSAILSKVLFVFGKASVLWLALFPWYYAVEETTILCVIEMQQCCSAAFLLC